MHGKSEILFSHEKAFPISFGFSSAGCLFFERKKQKETVILAGLQLPDNQKFFVILAGYFGLILVIFAFSAVDLGRKASNDVTSIKHKIMYPRFSLT